MKLQPRSRARSIVRIKRCSSSSPRTPAPRQIGETFTPAWPSRRYSMRSSSLRRQLQPGIRERLVDQAERVALCQQLEPRRADRAPERLAGPKRFEEAFGEVLRQWL